MITSIKVVLKVGFVYSRCTLSGRILSIAGTSCTCIRRVFVNNHNHFDQSSVKSRVHVLFKSTLSDRILSIAGTSCTCIRRVFDRGSLVLRQFGSVLIGNTKYKYGNGRGNNGVFLYSRVVLDFEAVWYVVFAASTHHWQFRRRYCGCSLFTVLILFANNTHTAPHHLLAPRRFSPLRGKQSRIDRGWYCNLFHGSSNLMVDPSIAFLAVAKHWHSHAFADGIFI